MKRLVLVLACAGCGGSVVVEPAADAMPPVSDGPTLLVATPSTSRVHGGVTVVVTYDGVVPDQVAFNIIGSSDGSRGASVHVDPVAHTLTFVTPAHTAGPVALQLVDADLAKVITERSDLLSYVATNAAPSLTLVRSSLDTPLRPELARPCARIVIFGISNSGDEVLDVAAATSSDLAFSFASPIATDCHAVEYGQTCSFDVCFDSSVPGPHDAHLELTVTGGSIGADVSAVTLAATPDFGTAVFPLHPTRGALDNYDGASIGDSTIGGAVAAPGGAFAAWWRFAFDSLDFTGTEADPMLYATTTDGFLANWIHGTCAGAIGQGAYVLIGDDSGGSQSVLRHLDDDLVLDAAWGPVSLPFLPQDSTYYRGVQVQPSGRVLAIGSHDIVAIANGAVDSTYGANGIVYLADEFFGTSAIDHQGRLYIQDAANVKRFLANGMLDASYHFAGSGGFVIDREDRVWSGNERLDDTGAVEITGPGNVLAVDASDRLYVVPIMGSGRVARYTPDLAFDRELGFDHAIAVRCATSGTCWIFGRDGITVPLGAVDPYAIRIDP